MMKKRFFRLLALVLCVLMLVPVMAACTERGGDDDTTTTMQPAEPDDTPETPDTPEPPAIVSSVAQMELGKNGGMSYIVQLNDGRFIVIDGGVDDNSSRLRMLSYMKSKTNAEKPVIACWMITHLDGDHFDNAYAFLRSFRTRVEVQGFAYTFPKKEDFKVLPTDSADIRNYKIGALSLFDDKLPKWETLKNLYPDAEYWDMKADDKKTFADVNIHVLITANERLPESVHTHNLRSAAFKMTFTQGTETEADDKSFMVFGDCSGNERSQYMLDTYGESVLKSDVMQVIHHGLAGGHTLLYLAVDPSICLWPQNEERFAGRYDSNGNGDYTDDYQYCTQAAYNKVIRQNPNIQHYHHSQTTVINMSDLSVSVWTMN